MFLLPFIFSFSSFSIAQSNGLSQQETNLTPTVRSSTVVLQQAEPPLYEMRAAWVATVDQIDWPSRGNYQPEKQRQEFREMLDMHQKNGMNAVVVQVRPATDAFYPSQFEPWSEWLTGKQGKAPDPFYDPLQFMIEETHKRGMEFHAWFNPYRAVFNIKTSSVAPNHITRQKPEWFLTYGDKKYFDPGIPEVRNYLTEAIREVVKNYAVDAIHFDDYFYPYRLPGKEFPDAKSFATFGAGMNKEDWRRSNVDSIILQLSQMIKMEKPWMKFGISPFGVWRNSDRDPIGSPTKGGQTNYDDLYADVLLWLKKGWIDYVTPQLYWERGHKLVAYETLLDWWSKYTFGRHLYIGHGIYRVNDVNNAKWKNPEELPAQLQLLRNNEQVQGSMYFSSKSFRNNPNGWNDSLQNNYYRFKALVPIMPWLDTTAPGMPSVEYLTVQPNGRVRLEVRQLPQHQPIRGFVLYGAAQQAVLAEAGSPALLDLQFIPEKTVFDVQLPAKETRFLLQVRAISHNNVESEPTPIFLFEKDAKGNWMLNPLGE